MTYGPIPKRVKNIPLKIGTFKLFSVKEIIIESKRQKKSCGHLVVKYRTKKREMLFHVYRGRMYGGSSYAID